MPDLKNKIVDTTKFSAMAEFRRRIENRTNLKNILTVLDQVSTDYGVKAFSRQGALYPNVYTLGFVDDQGREVSQAFNVEEKVA